MKAVLALVIVGALSGCAGLSTSAVNTIRAGAVAAVQQAKVEIGLNIQGTEDERINRIAQSCTTAIAIVTVWRLEVPVLEEEGQAFCAAVFAEQARRAG
ncbi:MAG: hypothetical protein AAFN05_14360 [Pseudomonadota bacterium]